MLMYFLSIVIVWLTTQQQQSSVAFLPVNPLLTPLRNQGRQKLATLDASDFRQLLIDLLSDTKRWQTLSASNAGMFSVCVLCMHAHVTCAHKLVLASPCDSIKLFKNYMLMTSIRNDITNIKWPPIVGGL